jgi:hypothetical protein
MHSLERGPQSGHCQTHPPAWSLYPRAQVSSGLVRAAAGAPACDTRLRRAAVCLRLARSKGMAGFGRGGGGLGGVGLVVVLSGHSAAGGPLIGCSPEQRGLWAHLLN